MDQEKLSTFIGLIDEALRIARERREIMQTSEFYQKLKEAGWITEEDIQLGKQHLEERYNYIFHYEFLDGNIMQALKNIRRKCETLEIEKQIEGKPKGSRGNFGWTRGISDCGHNMWGDELYGNKIYKACAAVEKYYNRELE